MQVKLFEVRDRATFIPVMAININLPNNDDQRYLIRRAGYGIDQNYVVLIKIVTMECEYDPFKWPQAGIVRTMPTAHKYIRDNFDTLNDGDVIDVEYILGETSECKISEKYSH